MRLANYSNDKTWFEFEPETGHFSKRKLQEPRANLSDYSGFAQLLKPNLFSKSVLVAIYIQNNEPFISVGSKQWPLYTDNVTVKHAVLNSGHKCELTIIEKNHKPYVFRYRRKDAIFSAIDPTYDFLDYSIAHLLADFELEEGKSTQELRDSFVSKWGQPNGA